VTGYGSRRSDLFPAGGEDLEPCVGRTETTSVRCGRNNDVADERFDRLDNLGQRVSVVRVSGSASNCRC
jgi:hypothetical protein